MSDANRKERQALWGAFLKEWPPERLRRMSLDDYTNARREDAFVYWLEIRLQDLGGIRGGSAFKFGIARRTSRKKKTSGGGRAYDKHHMWMERFGKTPEAAFDNVRKLIVDVVDAAQAGRLDIIDGINLAPIVKWKIAFLYQDQSAGLIFPIYKRDCLFHHHRQSVDPKAVRTRTTYGQMYRALSERLRKLDVFERADGLWRTWTQASQAPERRDWVVPLGAFGIDGELAETLCAMEAIEASQLPKSLRTQLESRTLRAGDRVALLDGEVVRALGTVQTVQAGALSWDQTPCQKPALADAEPERAEILEVTSWRVRDAIWGPSESQRAAAQAPFEPCPPPTNLIFYGPPGTGKTREALRRALTICGEDPRGLSEEAVSQRVGALQSEGRLELVTFHPSYGYEEFIEGIRPVLDGAEGLGYECADGAFKRAALRATFEGLVGAHQGPVFAGLWTRLTREVRDAEGDYLVESLDGQIHGLAVTSRGNLEARRLLSVEDEEAWVADRKQVVSRDLVEALWARLPEGEPERESFKALVVAIKGDKRGIAAFLWPIVQALRELAGRSTSPTPEARRARAREALQKGQQRALKFSAEAPAHVLIIDEINRGNISRIMGELITLLEPSRRLGAPDAMSIRLAVSQERFAVPPNLHVIGTMNTADRSIALMDVALRRRFVFEERMPDAEAIGEVLGGVEPGWRALVVALFEALNARIRYLYDREHQIGHAYFLGATDPQALRWILVQRVFPLLQEYFYDAWDSICMVLGCPYDESGRPLRGDAHCVTHSREGVSYRSPIVTAKVLREAEVLGIAHGDRDDRLVFGLNPVLLAPETGDAQLIECFEAALRRPLEPGEPGP